VQLLGQVEGGIKVVVHRLSLTRAAVRRLCA
jgi:hypothetical protein